MKIFKNIAVYIFDLIDSLVHQKKIIKFLKKNNIKITNMIDVGSYKGLYTDLILQNYNIKKAILFEPQVQIFKYIKKKYKKKKNITTYKHGVSNRNSFQILKLNYHDLTSSLSDLNQNSLYLTIKARLFGVNISNMIYRKLKIKTVKLSDVLAKNKFRKVDLLKIDTEGHELQVLQGLEKKINKVNHILIEFHNDQVYLKYNPKKIHNYLCKNNFVLRAKFKFPLTTWEDRFYSNTNENK
jgi:FkbM family methyltransferase